VRLARMDSWERTISSNRFLTMVASDIILVVALYLSVSVCLSHSLRREIIRS
jgi:hypothetical protein